MQVSSDTKVHGGASRVGQCLYSPKDAWGGCAECDRQIDSAYDGTHRHRICTKHGISESRL